VERIHDRHRVGELLGGGGLEAGEPVHRDDLDPIAPGVGSGGEPGLEGLLRATLDHVQQPGGAGLVADRGQVDDHGDVPVAAPGVPPDVLIDADDPHAVEAGRVVDENTSAFSKHGVVGGVPGDVESLGDPGDGEVLHDQRFERPPQPTARELRPRLGRTGGVLAPHVPAAGAAVATHRDLQHRRSPPQRLVREPTDHGVPSSAFGAAASTPLVRGQDSAGEHRAVGLEALAGHDEVEFVESAERCQVRASEAGPSGSDRQRRQTSGCQAWNVIFRRPRPRSSHRRAGVASINEYTSSEARCQGLAPL